METVALTVAAFFLSASPAFGENIYEAAPMTWPSAQEYCREHYVDLSPISSRAKGRYLLAGKIQGELWTGLHREGNQWKWSGGGNATTIPWAPGRSHLTSEDCGSACWGQCAGATGLRTERCDRPMPFLCYNLVVPQVRKTWEGAFQFCRQNHTGLARLPTENERLLALSKVQQGTSERVWVGLRFLGHQWMWLSGHSVNSRALNQGDGERRCPVLKRCGTLTRGDLLESWDCTDQLRFLCY